MNYREIVTGYRQLDPGNIFTIDHSPFTIADSQLFLYIVVL
jgi:hypothetical protein